MVRRRRLTRSRRWTNAVKRVVNSQLETKHHRVDTSGSFDDTGTMIELNSVDSQGVASGQFVGQEIRQMGIMVRGKLVQADSYNIARYAVVQLTAEGQLLIDAGTISPSQLVYNNANAIYSAWREPLIAKVYTDRTVSLNMASGQNDQVRLMKFFVKLHGKKYKFNEASLTSSGSNKIHLVLFSDSLLPTDPTYDFESILYYKDG